MTILKSQYEKDLYPEVASAIDQAGDNDFARDCIEIAATKLARGEIGRRGFLAAIGAMGALAATGPWSKAFAQAEELVVVNWGGPAVEAYQKAWGEPFTEETGIEVIIDGTGPLLSKIRAMVESGAVTWDVCDTGAGTTLVLQKANVLEPIDYSIVDKAKIVQDYAYEYGAANYLFSFILAYNKARLDSEPQNWVDFWDTAKFPGGRTLRQQPNGMLEAAMFAAGRSKEEIYPIDMDLAREKFAEIRDDVIVWGSGSESQQLFRNGEVVMGNIWHTRANLLNQDMRGDVVWTWNDGIVTAGMWNVPKGNPAGTEAAMKFIASSQDPEQQVELFKMMGNGPANPAAAPLVPEDMRYIDPGQPENFAKQIKQDARWYEADSGVGDLTNDALSREMYLDVMSG
ncbi:ABC transporter substrate-binding protein [Acuticoccus sp.]|uniref:ABC transporter substrate-binding protein n=1 Tax=Acuticoccus sp. TaxID=1904378 RepID=UPI003B525EB3